MSLGQSCAEYSYEQTKSQTRSRLSGHSVNFESLRAIFNASKCHIRSSTTSSFRMYHENIRLIFIRRHLFKPTE